MDILLNIPENLDFDNLYKEFPIEGLSGVKEDYIAYICHAIITRKAYRGDEGFEHKKAGYVPLSSKVLQKVIPEYKKCIDYMIMAGIIECDNHYIPMVVGKGYRLASNYWGVEYTKFPIKDYVLFKNLKKGIDRFFDHENKKSQKKYRYLKKWFEKGKLRIDVKGAMEWIDTFKNEELRKIDWSTMSKPTKDNHRRKLIDKCNGYKIIVEQFCEKKYNPIIDGSGFRLHTILTRLKKELRQFVTYDGQKLVAIDISCSQPYLGLILLSNKFWDKKPNKGMKGFRKLDNSNYEKVYKTYLTDSYTIMLRENAKSLYQSDIQLQKYIRLVTTGGLYEYLMDILNESRKSEGIKFDRSIAKKMVLKAFYCNESHPSNQQCDSYNLIFKRTFPTMGRLFSIVKAEDYKGVAILLQRVESYVVLEQACKRISIERPDLPLFTIHDSIVTTEGNEGYIKRVMGEELLNYVGYPAHFKIESWGESKKLNGKINYTLIKKNNEYRLVASNGF